MSRGASAKRKADELERQTNFRTSQQHREAAKSRYDKLEPAKKKARIQQIMAFAIVNEDGRHFTAAAGPGVTHGPSVDGPRIHHRRSRCPASGPWLDRFKFRPLLEPLLEEQSSGRCSDSEKPRCIPHPAPARKVSS